MKRDTVINVLLIIVGIIVAIALFGAGVLWKRAEQQENRDRFRPRTASFAAETGRHSGGHSASICG